MKTLVAKKFYVVEDSTTQHRTGRPFFLAGPGLFTEKLKKALPFTVRREAEKLARAWISLRRYHPRTHFVQIRKTYVHNPTPQT